MEDGTDKLKTDKTWDIPTRPGNEEADFSWVPSKEDD